ncbi:hypothetical protein [Aeromonas sp. sif2433]|uniref:hypothetical protein n=1 Tax=Aeromonas sp. sif2433 TaxID=2854794 RepID=UPI001C441E21|nr:hypothetical protein [Aeromonas sp. sif2433]MBV7413595.1 hypothetical protein [Aeromonas sp. sif2433]
MKKKPVFVAYGGTILCATTGKILWIAEGCHYDKANPGARDWLNLTFKRDEYQLPGDEPPEPPKPAWSPYAEGE